MSGRRAIAGGALAAAAALLVVWAAGALGRAIPYPPAVLASLIIKAAPGGLATAMIERLGHWALRALILGVHLGVLAFAGWLGMVIRRPADPRARARRGLGVSGLLLLASLVLGVAAPEGLSPLAPLAYLGGGLVFARLSSGVSLGRALDPELKEAEAPLDSIERSRRRFLVRLAAALGGLAVGGFGTWRFLTGKMPIDVELATAGEPFVPPPEDPGFPEVAGLTPEITSNRDFYTVDINIIKPSVDHERWRLDIHGLVDHPYQLTYRQLQEEFEVVEIAHTLICISNQVGGDLISTAVWRGVRLREVLERAGLREGIVDVVFRAVEGYTDSIPLAKGLEDTTLVVFGMNGAPLPREHGFPARIIVPGIYGMKNVKWLTEIEPVDHDYKGYWMVRGWSDIATVKTQSRIDVPARRALIPATAAGIAWAGDRRVIGVEISEDEGATWRPAVLKRELSPLAWRLWAADLSPGSGRRQVRVRATDGEGAAQEARKTSPHPEGASGHHEVVLEIE